MTHTQLQTIRRAITLLCSLIDEPQECAPVPLESPVRQFAEQYLAPDPDADITCEEAWRFFQEIVRAGELTAMRKTVFFRQLPTTLEGFYRVRKSHNIERSGHRVRGFRGIGIRMDAGLATVLQTSPERTRMIT